MDESVDGVGHARAYVRAHRGGDRTVATSQRCRADAVRADPWALAAAKRGKNDAVLPRACPFRSRAPSFAWTVALTMISFVIATLTLPPRAIAQTDTTVHIVTPSEYVDQALGVIERNSFYAPKVDMAAIRRRAMTKAAQAPNLDATYPIIDEAIKATGDRHGLFRPPATQTLLTQGKIEGYGLVIVWPSRLVVSLASGGPAELAGVKLGDRVDEVNGQAPEHGAHEVVFPKDTAGVLLPDVTLSLHREAQQLTVAIHRGQASTVNVPVAQAAPTAAGSALAGQVGYLEVPGLVGDPGTQTTFAQQTQALLGSLDGAARCGWVIDLRKNKGGYIAAMLAGIAPLVGPSPLVASVRADGSRLAWTYSDGDLRQGNQSALRFSPSPALPSGARPVAVLTSALTASAAEATALAFKGRAKARVFGEPTFGLTSYTALSVLHDGASVTVTNALDVDAAGRTYDGPVPPDELVAVDWSQIATPTDPVLSAAVRWLGGLKGCAVPKVGSTIQASTRTRRRR